MPDQWVTIAVRDWIEAQLIKGLLESSGFLVRLQAEPLGKVYGLTVSPMGMVLIQVPESLAEQARTLLAAEKGEETSGAG
ncbi:hypothetical protein [Neomoorella thermoacetica]|uniref:hypothetical protein n=1 Tax=Neomoorella thermoacetica TaxID=1525 RepID=UPI0008FA9AB1|nr:hypothetical protein [Moorella thermoacetica]OIQ11236.1 hypothetical protein MOOTH_18090 [Moorella thermoacetica]